jgi:transcription initiation factor TFIID/TFIIF subunit
LVHSEKDSGVEGFPIRRWSIEIFVLNEHGEEVPATLFNKVTYRLHPSFGERATQGMSIHSHARLTMVCCADTVSHHLAFTSPPFRINEEGWGEFDMSIVLGAPDKDYTITHDLNFQKNRYESKHVIVSSSLRPLHEDLC